MKYNTIRHNTQEKKEKFAKKINVFNVYSNLDTKKVSKIRNVSSNIDYVYVVKTGRYAYIRTNAYK